MKGPQRWFNRLRHLPPNLMPLEFDLRGPCGQETDMTPGSCPLTSTLSSWHVCTHAHTCKHIKQSVRNLL